MRKLRLIPIALLALLMALLPVWPDMAIVFADDTPDPTSAGLTNDLHQHRLPAVGAQVTNMPDGGKTVVLYGFVATEKGKTDAEIRARNYLNDPSVAITNRIRIDPTILASNKPGSANSQIDDYQNEGNPDSSGNGSGSNGSGGNGSTSTGSGSSSNAPLPPNVGSMQAYQQSGNPMADPYNQGGVPVNGLGTGLMIIGPIIGGLLLYNALSGPSYNNQPYYGHQYGGGHHGHR
jgi:hypothetical protein